MKVSIILPVVEKYSHFAKEAEASIDAQTIPVEKIIIDANGKNVAQASNEGAAKAKGQYIMRLDCDDKLHLAAIQLMINYLDMNPACAAVYSDYYEVNEKGEIAGIVEVKDIPHPGCMLIKKSYFDEVGGFNEALQRQEGTDFYYRLSQIGEIYHLDLPLWHYRRHGKQMSNQHNEVIKARHEVKDTHNHSAEKILAIIPARGGSKGIPRKNLVKLDGLPLMVHAIRMAKSSRHDLYIVVSSEDDEILEVAKAEGVAVIERPQEDAEDDVNLITVAKHTMEQVASEFKADIVITIQPTAPFQPVEALDSALDRMLANPEIDAVVSMTENLGRHPYRLYHHLEDNLYGCFFKEEAEMFPQRQDRPQDYMFTGGFYARRRKVLEEWNGEDFALGNWEGELVTQEQGIDIDTKFDLLLARALLHEEEL